MEKLPTFEQKAYTFESANFEEKEYIPNKQDAYGDSSQHWAALKADVPKLKWLYTHGADMNIVNKKGMTPLHEVASFAHGYKNFKNSRNAILFLIENGANKNAKNNMGETAFMIATRKMNEWPK